MGKYDDWMTPPWVAAQLAAEVIPRTIGPLTERHVVIEPCSGHGHIVDALAAAWPLAVYESSEANPTFPRPRASAFHFVGDFLAPGNGWVEPGAFDGQSPCVVTNPPFSLCVEFADQSLAFADHVLLLLRLSVLASQKRHGWITAHPPAKVLVMSTRPSFIDPRAAAEGKRREGSDNTEYGWFYWRRGHTDAPTIEWIKPIPKARRKLLMVPALPDLQKSAFGAGAPEEGNEAIVP